MPASFYLHTDLAGVGTASEQKGFVLAGDAPAGTQAGPLEIALFTMRLALKLGVQPRKDAAEALLPYSATHDNLVFDAPLTSLVCGRRMAFLRGWKQYGSCVKGFNGLGLMAEHAWRETRRLERLAPAELREERLAFLASRKTRNTPVFTAAELEALREDEIAGLDMVDIALWKSFGARTIVCSTSSNMGISLHEALRYMQRTPVTIGGKSGTILNDDEGWLIIWCPDEQADFMNSEKTETLRGLENEQPPLTVLHTYINRKQRDPGALKDALEDGGYFFPTNPQSKDEIQNLLSFSLDEISRERRCGVADLLKDPKILTTLESLNCVVKDGRVTVTSGVEGGLYGLMTAYLVMLDETLIRSDVEAISTWNQASIGAALAAAVLADVILREPSEIADATRAELRRLFPGIDEGIRRRSLGTQVQTRIHGVFDLANLQSLAQLLGVVVERHLSGRGTAFVGLGSSSYANGNRCYEILKNSVENDGPFAGKLTFHPATHTLSPIAQALVFAEDFARATAAPEFAAMNEEARIDHLLQHSHKPEPAGAAALAGYLLSRLDARTLSVAEISYALRLAGFSSATFLEFAGFLGEQGASHFLQEAYEEGPYMEELARSFLQLLDWKFADLEKVAAVERSHSRLNYRLSPLDPDTFEALNPLINIYLTGDNTRQPRRPLVRTLLHEFLAGREKFTAALEGDREARFRDQKFDGIAAVKIAFAKTSSALRFVEKTLHRAGRAVLDREVQRRVDGIANGQPKL
jgi:hypothetical protein